MIRALAVAAGLGLSAGVASADFLGIELRDNSVEDALASLELGSPHKVLKMFASFDAPAEVLVAAQSGGGTGFGLGNLYLDTGAGFYQTPPVLGGGDTAPNSGFFGISPLLKWDTFISLNQNDSIAGDTTALDPDFSFVDTDGDTIDDFVAGGWFNSAPANIQGEAVFNASTSRYEVFLGQFTLAGLPSQFATPNAPAMIVQSVFDGELTIFIDNPGTTPIQEVVTFSEAFVPAPGALALFGVGGLVATRRRRTG